MPAVTRYADTWIDEDRLGSKYPFYRATFPLSGQFIDGDHAHLAACRMQGAIIDTGIPGWLRPADALKLYEMAYFSPGDVLELGAYHGLSTSIEATALRNAGRGRRIVSLELDPSAAAKAMRNTEAWADFRTFIIGDARASCQSLIAQRHTFGFAFVDHSHTYELVLAACEDLKFLLPAGGFALFHDFNDPKNGKHPDYGVWQAVRDGFADGSFEFFGIFGCTGLWRRGHDGGLG